MKLIQRPLSDARALMHRPGWQLLNVATCALDEASEAAIYRLLAQRLPETTVISIGHRSSLAQYHQRHLEIQAGDGDAGARRVVWVDRAAGFASVA